MALKILHVSESLMTGGAEKFLLRLAHKLNELGHHCDVLNLNPDMEDARQLASYPGLRVHHVRTPSAKWLRRIDRRLARAGLTFSLQQWFARRDYVRRFAGSYDIAHSQLFGADLLLAGVAQEKPGFVYVSTLHGDYFIYGSEGHQTGSPHRWRELLQQVLRTCKTWVATSRPQHDQLVRSFRVSPERLTTIYSGFEPSRPLPAPAGRGGEELRFVMAARGIADKGWDYLLQAFAQLKGRATLTLIGEGPEIDRLRPLYADDPRIRFAGFHPDPVELVQSADVFVFPSVYAAESLPNVVIEALFCGIPVIATDIGDIRQMLTTPEGSISGVLLAAEPRDGIVESLRRAMEAYLQDQDLLHRHRALAREAFEKFDMTACAERYVSLYRRCLAET
jgi:glycosyltransferase involved in cell wall biosynthesis